MMGDKEFEKKIRDMSLEGLKKFADDCRNTPDTNTSRDVDMAMRESMIHREIERKEKSKEQDESTRQHQMILWMKIGVAAAVFSAIAAVPSAIVATYQAREAQASLIELQQQLSPTPTKPKDQPQERLPSNEEPD